VAAPDASSLAARARGQARRLKAALGRLRRHAAYAEAGQGLDRVGLLGPLSDRPDDWAPFLRFAPPGHFYSPIPRLSELDARASTVFDRSRRSLPGIALDEERQRQLFIELTAIAADWAFPELPDPEWRYFSGEGNFAYCLGDALVLHAMLRKLQPKRLVEIGSGFSSCMTLDTNERFLDSSVELTFIEPYPELLYRLLGDRRGAVEVVEQPVQDVDLSRFEDLDAGDILFIDSTHVAKVGSDVNHLVANVLPRVPSGVFIHIHDVFWPFEYPEPWVREGRAWSELYVVRAFLQYNHDFEIVFFNDWFGEFERDLIAARFPRMLDAPGGALWLRRC
jgi:hypothetical protein